MTNVGTVRHTIEKVLPAELVLEEVTITPAGRRRVVRVVVDRSLPDTSVEVTEPTPPLSLDEVSDASREVSAALDGSDAMGSQPYTLEVTSPGTARPLTEPRHFQRNVGRLVRLTSTDGSVTTGHVTSAGPGSVTVEVPAAKKSPARTVESSYDDLSKAVVEVEFNRPGTDAPDRPLSGGQVGDDVDEEPDDGSETKES